MKCLVKGSTSRHWWIRSEWCLFKSTKTNKHKVCLFLLLQYKWLLRGYLTPVKLQHMSDNIPDVCTKCLTDKGTLFHCVWKCSKIQNFWKEVIKCLSEMFNAKVPLNAKLCVLGINLKKFLQTSKQCPVLDFGLLQTRRVIGLFWKSMYAPTLRRWIRERFDSVGLDRWTYIITNKQKDFAELLEPYLRIMTDGNVRFIWKEFVSLVGMCLSTYVVVFNSFIFIFCVFIDLTSTQMLDPPVGLLLHSFITCEEDPEILELLHLRLNFTPNTDFPAWAVWKDPLHPWLSVWWLDQYYWTLGQSWTQNSVQTLNGFVSLTCLPCSDLSPVHWIWALELHFGFV